MSEQGPQPDSEQRDPKLQGTSEEDERLEDLELDEEAADDVEGGAYRDEWGYSATPSPN